MKSFIVKHLFVTYVFVGLLLQVIVYFNGAQYDSDGYQGLLYWFSIIFGFLFWIPSEIIFAINNGLTISHQTCLSIILGILFACLIDWILLISKSVSSQSKV